MTAPTNDHILITQADMLDLASAAMPSTDEVDDDDEAGALAMAKLFAAGALIAVRRGICPCCAASIVEDYAEQLGGIANEADPVTRTRTLTH